MKSLVLATMPIIAGSAIAFLLHRYQMKRKKESPNTGHRSQAAARNVRKNVENNNTDHMRNVLRLLSRAGVGAHPAELFGFLRANESGGSERSGERVPAKGGVHMDKVLVEPKVLFEDSPRFTELMSMPVANSGVAYYDPQCDEPLPPEIEHNLQALGGPLFLQQLCQMHDLDVNPLPTSEWECARAARKTIRTAVKQFTGERLIQ